MLDMVIWRDLRGGHVASAAPEEVHGMIAGRGITHSERFRSRQAAGRLLGARGVGRLGGLEAEGKRLPAVQWLTPVIATAPTTLMALGGEPIGSRPIEWSFVSLPRSGGSNGPRLTGAQGRKLPDLGNREFIPWPADQHLPASAKS
jgi:redox-sensitive bicupin YhaK (pirin superfamily)